MKIDRANLVAALKRVDAALSSKDLVQVLACFCFTEKEVFAYDDTACLRMPYKLGLSGGVRGALLLGWLSSCRAKEVEVSQDGETIKFKAGRSVHDTTLIPESEFLFEQPDLEGAAEVKVDMEFLAALSKAASSMGRDASLTWQYGVTVVPAGSGHVLYSTDDKTVMCAKAGKISKEKGEAILLPPRFVDLLLAISKTDSPKKMLIAEQWGLVTFASGLKLFTKTVVGADPENFTTYIDDVKSKMENPVDIPKGIERCIDRSLLVAKFSREPYVRLAAGSGRLKFETKSDAGDVKDSLPCDHADISVLVEPGLIQRGLPGAEKLTILENCMCMTGKGTTFICSTIQTGAKTEKTE
jgi:DNA polymerase III sliding clamp (beta) subunit (PCNA family)